MSSGGSSPSGRDLKHLPVREYCRSEQIVLRYRVYGRGTVPLVLLHGLAAWGETWSDLVPLIPPDDYTVYIPDLIGSGLSSKPVRADYSIRGHAQTLISFLADTGIQRACLVGHSLGGAIALLARIEAVRQQREDLIERLVLIAAPGFLQRLPLMVRILRLPLAGPLFLSLSAPEMLVRKGLEMVYYDQGLVNSLHIARYAPCYRGRDTKRALLATCRSIVPPDCEEIGACYRHIGIPVLLIWGREDRVVRLSQGRRLNEALPGSRLAIIDECGHNPHEEKPRETVGLIRGFMEGFPD